MTNEITFHPDINKLNTIKDGVVDVLKTPYGIFYASLIAGIFGYAIYKNYGISYDTTTGIISMNAAN